MVEYKKHPTLNITVSSIGEIIGREQNLSTGGYLMFKFNNKNYSSHRIIYEAMNNVILKKDEQIDHIDRIKTNNNIDNLRVVTNTQNQYNTCKNRIFLANYNNETYISNAISYFARKFNLQNENISKALNKERRHVKGWIFIDIDNNIEYEYLIKKYIDESEDIIVVKNITELENLNLKNSFQGRFDKVILATNIKTNDKYIFSNLANFCKVFNLTSANASKVLKGERKKHKDFKFEFSSEYENLKIDKNDIIKI